MRKLAAPSAIGILPTLPALLCRPIADHGGKGGFRRDLAVDDRLARKLPDAGPALHLLDMKLETVARKDRPAEPDVIDRHEVDQLAFRLLAVGRDHKNGGGLRHRLDDQHTRHHRLGREVALEAWLVDA